MSLINSLPYPMGAAQVRGLTESDRIVEAHHEVIAQRSGTEVVPAMLITTEAKSVAVVEDRERERYRVLASGDRDDREDVYAELREWATEQGYGGP
ncbi:hypothetical protein [Halobaculum magnesiiphilum]|uniref:DUF7964 domain-containing protein n=1 Tax=Halobaculum magnesiiphilum TaxID=1017351 RepID=A0A8T8W9T6_9EURY|nr:hypothetical protein [Halobaculum magnesiiphilum]QZP36622.1 hypothetical protein K6T50_09880 [Halobaculum magnesiiphilum]